jgi:hypothetical protein
LTVPSAISCDRAAPTCSSASSTAVNVFVAAAHHAALLSISVVHTLC